MPREAEATRIALRRASDPERADLDGWLVRDAREDGWTLVVCRKCQTPSERVRIERLR